MLAQTPRKHRATRSRSQAGRNRRRREGVFTCHPLPPSRTQRQAFADKGVFSAYLARHIRGSCWGWRLPQPGACSVRCWGFEEAELGLWAPVLEARPRARATGWPWRLITLRFALPSRAASHLVRFEKAE
jgi:hypothetical protein